MAYDGGFDEAQGRPAKSGFDRRAFVKRVAVTTAFVAPVVTSLSMSGVNSAFATQALGSNTSNVSA
jgi:hypothetical protein